MEEKRFFSFKNADGEVLKMSVRKPTTKEIEAADVEYSKAFFVALKKGLPTRDVLADALNESGAWTEEKDKEIENLEKEIVLLSQKQVTGKEKKRIEEKVSELTDKENQLRRTRNNYFSHCVEASASDAQRDFIVSCVTEYQESGEKVWKDFNAFKDEEDGNVLFRATYEHLTFSNGVESNIPNEEEEKEVVVEQKPEEKKVIEEKPAEEVKLPEQA